MKRPVRIPKAVSLFLSPILLPALLIAGVISIPISMIDLRIRRRRIKAFETRMKAKGRTIDWPDFERAVGENLGTVIVERHSFKAADHSWWIPEDLYEQTPYAVADWYTMRLDQQFDVFSRWCHDRYTSPDRGTALLVLEEQAATDQRRAMHLRFMSGEMNWIEVVPPDALRGKRRQSSNASSPPLMTS